MKTTNIYIITDISFRMSRNSAKLQQTFTKMQRSLEFLGEKTKLTIIGYNDRAKLLSPFGKLQPTGNPNLAEGLKFLSSAVTLDKRNKGAGTRSIFLFYLGENVLQGWQPALQELYRNKHFAFGLRYVVAYSNMDRYAQKAAERLTDSPDRILRYFSENRLTALIKTIKKDDLLKNFDCGKIERKRR